MNELEERKQQLIEQLQRTSFSGLAYNKILDDLRDLKTKWIDDEVSPYLEKIGMKYANN